MASVIVYRIVAAKNVAIMVVEDCAVAVLQQKNVKTENVSVNQIAVIKLVGIMVVADLVVLVV